MTNNAQFQIGRTYTCRSICDHDTVYAFTVIKRTAKRITFTDRFGKMSTRGVYFCDLIEHCKPHGTYSMCAVIGADDFEGATREPSALEKSAAWLEAQATIARQGAQVAACDARNEAAYRAERDTPPDMLAAEEITLECPALPANVVDFEAFRARRMGRAS